MFVAITRKKNTKGCRGGRMLLLNALVVVVFLAAVLSLPSSSLQRRSGGAFFVGALQSNPQQQQQQQQQHRRPFSRFSFAGRRIADAQPRLWYRELDDQEEAIVRDKAATTVGNNNPDRKKQLFLRNLRQRLRRRSKNSETNNNNSSSRGYYAFFRSKKSRPLLRKASKRRRILRKLRRTSNAPPPPSSKADHAAIKETKTVEEAKKATEAREITTKAATTAATTAEASSKATPPSKNAATTKPAKDSAATVVCNVHELRNAILDQEKKLSDIDASRCEYNTNATVQELLNHDVLRLVSERFRSRSLPGNRSDGATLALCIEGGGMRGAVSAGMAAAIASLGLIDSFDTIYGSSAGSVIGAYMVSRQMCMDVYVDILPAAKQRFVCTKRLVSSALSTAVQVMLSSSSSSSPAPASASPTDAPQTAPQTTTTKEAIGGMNISFVLDGIMDPNTGLRPLDTETFIENNKKQPLKIATSYVVPTKTTTNSNDEQVRPKEQQHSFRTTCFGARDFFGPTAVSTSYEQKQQQQQQPSCDSLFACLKASMTVPGATGPPVKLITNNNDPATTAANNNDGVDDKKEEDPLVVGEYFDAFCFQPLPYRSAVYDDNATHALVLCSKPEGTQPKTKPTLYETILAPNYFRSNNIPSAARFFQNGGQQYIYLEDLLTLEEGKNRYKNNIMIQNSSSSKNGDENMVLVPPPDILYGIEDTQQQESEQQQQQNVDAANTVKNRENTWRKAHLFPLKVPAGVTELGTLENGKEEVQRGVRDGFAAAFDLLAPIVGLHFVEDYEQEDNTDTSAIDNVDGSSSGKNDNNKRIEMTGAQVARLVFPDVSPTVISVANSSSNTKKKDISSTRKKNTKKQEQLENKFILENKIQVVGDAIPDTDSVQERGQETPPGADDDSPLLLGKVLKRKEFKRFVQGALIKGSTNINNNIVTKFKRNGNVVSSIKGGWDINNIGMNSVKNLNLRLAPATKIRKLLALATTTSAMETTTTETCPKQKMEDEEEDKDENITTATLERIINGVSSTDPSTAATSVTTTTANTVAAAISGAGDSGGSNSNDVAENHVVAKQLLSVLPGFQDGKMNHLAKGLKVVSSQRTATATPNDRDGD